MTNDREVLYDNRECVCGSQSFRLEPAMFENGTFVAGTVVVNEEWSVVGWSGILMCANCGTELPHPELDEIGLRPIETDQAPEEGFEW